MLPSSTDLVYFHALANELHVSRAALKLAVSQPTLSLAIQRLEKTLETSLFIRHKQGMTLTRSGHILFKDVKGLLEKWEQVTTNIKNAEQTVIGSVSIGCHSTLAPFMSSMVCKLLKLYPHLEIHFQHLLTPQIIERLVQGHLDIGITTDPQLHPELIIQRITDTEFTFWMSAKKQQDIDLMAEDTLFICDPELAPTQLLLKQLEEQRTHKKLRLTTMNQIESIAAMTANSDGVGILPSRFTQQYFGDQLKKINNAPVYKKPLCLAYRPQMKNVQSIRIVLDEIRALIT